MNWQKELLKKFNTTFPVRKRKADVSKKADCINDKLTDYIWQNVYGYSFIMPTKLEKRPTVFKRPTVYKSTMRLIADGRC